MFCSISGVAPEEPVLCVKSGHVYEKRLITKHIEQTGRDPVSQEEISGADLIPIKSNRAVKPRAVTSASVPGMLQALQSEWDALMLETFNLRQQLDSTRQELSQALYQHDAACRVIARLIKERDSARAALSAAQAAIAQRVSAGVATPSTATADVEMAGTEAVSVAAQPAGLTESVLTVFRDKNKELSRQRRKRQVPAETVPLDALAQSLSVRDTFAPHSVSAPGITCLAVHPLANGTSTADPALAARYKSLILTGGNDKSALLYDVSNKRVAARLEGHQKRVSGVGFHPSRNVLYTASYDGRIRSFVAPEGDGPESFNFALSADLGCSVTEGAALTSLAVNPVGDYVAAGCRDGSWSLVDAAAGRVLLVERGMVSVADGGAYECGAFHPDALLLALGTQGAGVRVWDLRSQEEAAVLGSGDQGPVQALAFSENGFYFATSSSKDGTIRLFDLRKIQQFQEVAMPGSGNFSTTALAFDFSGQILAAGSSEGTVALWGTKEWGTPVFVNSKAHSAPVTGVAFANHGAALYTASQDRNVLLFTP